MKKLIIAIVIIFVVIAVGIFVIGRTFYPDNIAKTSADGGEKELKTRFYKSDVETVSRVVNELEGELTTYGRKWKKVGIKVNPPTIVQFEVPVVFFTDDLEVRIKKGKTEDEVQVDVLSKSRVGKSDFGENARHVRKILDALDEKFGKAN